MASNQNAIAPKVPPRPPLYVHKPTQAPTPRRPPAIMTITPPPQTAPLSPLNRLPNQRLPASGLNQRLAAPISPNLLDSPNQRVVSRVVNRIDDSLLSGETILEPINLNRNSPISLSQPRPDGARQVNEYVEAPFRHTVERHNSNIITKQPQRSIQQPSLAGREELIQSNNNNSITFSKSCRALASATSNECQSVRDSSIICRECGQCRCESCQQPRALPQRWVCNKKCLCSIDAIVDYATCLCCVKGLYYHCYTKDYELDRDGVAVNCADDPCSCAPHKRLTRWTCLAALSAVLPCLLCYWPLVGCARALEMCYAKHSTHGCRCTNNSSSQCQFSDVTLQTQLSESSSVRQTNNSVLRQTNSVRQNSAATRNEIISSDKRLLDSSPEI